MARLTKRQAEILGFITNHIEMEGDAPTVREIAEGFEIKSTNAVVDHLKALQRKGAILRDARSARGIRLPEEEVNAHRIPVLGNIAAGLPILAEENIQDWVTVGEDYLGKGDIFALRVQGESMIDAHIMNGDIVIVRQQQTAESGEIVAALIGEEATLKTYRPQGNKVLFLPANEAFNPLVFDKDSYESPQILGIAVGLMRQSIN